MLLIWIKISLGFGKFEPLGRLIQETQGLIPENVLFILDVKTRWDFANSHVDSLSLLLGTKDRAIL